MADQVDQDTWATATSTLLLGSSLRGWQTRRSRRSGWWSWSFVRYLWSDIREWCWRWWPTHGRGEKPQTASVGSFGLILMKMRLIKFLKTFKQFFVTFFSHQVVTQWHERQQQLSIFYSFSNFLAEFKNFQTSACLEKLDVHGKKRAHYKMAHHSILKNYAFPIY